MREDTDIDIDIDSDIEATIELFKETMEDVFYSNQDTPYFKELMLLNLKGLNQDIQNWLNGHPFSDLFLDEAERLIQSARGLNDN